MAKKHFLVGVGLAALLFPGIRPTLQSAHAQQSGVAASDPAAPITLEVRSGGVLRCILHAEGGMDPATKTLHQVTVLSFKAGKGEDVIVADTLQVRHEGQGQTWVMQGVQTNSAAGKIRAATLTMTMQEPEAESFVELKGAGVTHL